MHKQEKSDIRSGSALADALVKGLSQAGLIGNGKPANPVLEALAEVGLNQRQRAALVAAGLLTEEEADANRT